MAEDLGYGMDALDRVLGLTRAAVESMRGQEAAVPDPDDVRGTGEAAEGRVRATVVSTDQVESLHLDPRLLRSDCGDLTEQVLTAVNAAFADFNARTTARAPAVTTDPVVLADRLRGIQEESLRSMAAVTTALTDALSRAQRR